MSHLALLARPDCTIFHWDYGRAYIPLPMHDEIKKIMADIGAQDILIKTSPLYEKLGRNAVNVLGRELIRRVLPELKREGYDLDLVGLRREESSKRARRIDTGNEISPIREYWPMRNWKWLDIWAYIFTNELPYLSYYDKIAPLCGWDQARFTTIHDPEFANLSKSQDGVKFWRDKNYVNKA